MYVNKVPDHVIVTGKQLAEVNDELKQLPVGSEGFNKLSKEAQELTNELDKANEAA